MDDQTLSGELSQLRFFGEWAVGTLITKEGKVSVVGALTDVSQGMTVTVTGTWDVHPKYGKQLKVSSATRDVPTSERGIRAWLIQYIPNIGEIRASALVAKFGEGLWSIIETSSHQMVGIHGLTTVQVAEICTVYRKVCEERDVRVALYALGYSQGEASALIKEYGAAIAIAKVPPHTFHIGPPEFPFRRMEAVHARGGWDWNDPIRLVSGVLEGMKNSANDGHTLLGIRDIEHYAGDLLSVEDPEAIRTSFYKLLVNGSTVVALGDNQYMLRSQYDAERKIAATTLSLLRSQQAHEQAHEQE